MAEPFITYKLTVPNIPILHAEQSRQVIFREATLAVRAIVEDVASEARQRTPVNTGILRASIATNVTTGASLHEAIRGTVFTGARPPTRRMWKRGRRRIGRRSGRCSCGPGGCWATNAPPTPCSGRSPGAAHAGAICSVTRWPQQDRGRRESLRRRCSGPRGYCREAPSVP